MDEQWVDEPPWGTSHISEEQHAKYRWGAPISDERQAKLMVLAER